jgi:molecular chaperone GrpE
MTQKIDKAGADSEDEPIQVVDKRRFLNREKEGATAEEAEEPRYPSYVLELQGRLKEAEEQAEKLQSRYKQAQAQLEREADELRGRLQRNAEVRLETAKGEIYQRFIEVADNLERAIQSAGTGADVELLLVGVKATQALLLRQLEAEGVKAIVALDEPFDPTLHEAVDTVEVDPEREGKVIEVYKTGYKFGERLLRPAVVRVGRARSGKASGE